MEIDYLEDDTVSAREYSNLMSLYIKQMEKTASLQDENTVLHNMVNSFNKRNPIFTASKIDLVRLCKLWYVTRGSTQGMMIEDHQASALKAFDRLVDNIVERHGL